MKIFMTIFITVLLAELGDKTQLATLLFATDRRTSRLLVFLAATAALAVATGVAVLVGGSLEKCINPRYLCWAAGSGFIIIGLWTIIRA